MATERQEEIRSPVSEMHAQQTYKHFLRDLCAVGGLDEELARRASSSVLRRLTARLTRGEATDLAAQLPRKVVALLEGAHLDRPEKPREKVGRDEFVAGVAADLGKPEPEAEAITRAVFATVRAHIDEGEAEKVGMQLPQDLEHLWAQPT